MLQLVGPPDSFRCDLCTSPALAASLCHDCGRSACCGHRSQCRAVHGYSAPGTFDLCGVQGANPRPAQGARHLSSNCMVCQVLILGRGGAGTCRKKHKNDSVYIDLCQCLPAYVLVLSDSEHSRRPAFNRQLLPSLLS